MDKLRVLKHYAFQEVTAELLNSIGGSLLNISDSVAQAFIAGFENSDHLIFQDLDVTPDTGLIVNLGLKGVFLYRVDQENCIVGVYKGVRADKLSPWTEEQLTFDAADLVNPRIDIIEAEIVQEDDGDYFDTVQLFNPGTETSYAEQKYIRTVRNVKLYKKTGVPSANPVAPVATSGRFCVKEVYIGAGSVSLVVGDIRSASIMFNPPIWSQGLNNTKKFPSIYKSLEYLYDNVLFKKMYWSNRGAFSEPFVSLPSVPAAGLSPNLIGASVVKVDNATKNIWFGLSADSGGNTNFIAIAFSFNYDTLIYQSSSTIENLGINIIGSPLTQKGLAHDISLDGASAYIGLWNKLWKSAIDGTGAALVGNNTGLNDFSGKQICAVAHDDTKGIVILGMCDPSINSGTATILVSDDDFSSVNTVEIVHPSAQRPRRYSAIKRVSATNYVALATDYQFAPSDNNEGQVQYSNDDGQTWLPSDISSAERMITATSAIYQKEADSYDGKVYILLYLDSALPGPTPTQPQGWTIFVSEDDGESFQFYKSIPVSVMSSGAAQMKTPISFIDKMWFIAGGSKLNASPNDSTLMRKSFVTTDFIIFSEIEFNSSPVTNGYISGVARISENECVLLHTGGVGALYGKREYVPII